MLVHLKRLNAQTVYPIEGKKHKKKKTKKAAVNTLERPSAISTNVLGSIAAPSLTIATLLANSTPVSQHFNQVYLITPSTTSFLLP